jgi:uncharacterized membrane protein
MVDNSIAILVWYLGIISIAVGGLISLGTSVILVLYKNKCCGVEISMGYAWGIGCLGLGVSLLMLLFTVNHYLSYYIRKNGT